MPEREELLQLDRALLRLRRIWDAPAGIEHEGAVVGGSTLLVCLAVDEHGGATAVAEVAAALGVTPSTASRLVTRATDAGMVLRDTSDADPRRASLRLTGSGVRLVQASREFRTGLLARFTADWPADDLASLAALLGRFAAAVAAAPRPGPSGSGAGVA